MEWKNFKDHFDESWHVKMKPLIESEITDKIYAELKTLSKRGIKIVPASGNTFRAFRETKLSELRAVILGMCPYHTKGVADGLALSCSITQVLQPSLIKFYDGIEAECYQGLDLNYVRTPDLSYLAHQGVLLLNAALTTEVGLAGAHQKLWAPFIADIVDNIIAVTRVPVIAMGKEAAKFIPYFPCNYPIFEVEHPAHASYNGGRWKTNGVFTEVNRMIKDNNGEHIEWLYKLPL